MSSQSSNRVSKKIDPVVKIFLNKLAVREWTEFSFCQGYQRLMSADQYDDHMKTIRRARRTAQRIGLAYWPAFIDEAMVDPAAYKAAEEVLEAKYGLYTRKGGEVVCYGGWDSSGHYGVSARFVRSAWFAAGCRNSEKFRAQVRFQILAKKSESYDAFVAFARGYRWVVANRLGFNVSRKACAAIGRLPAELRWAATNEIRKSWNTTAPVRVRNLDWEEVRKAQEDIRAGNTRARAARVGVGLAAVILGLPFYTSEEEVVRALCPGYPRISMETARKIALGTPLIELYPGLTTLEADAYLRSGTTATPAEWLAKKLGVVYTPSIPILRWQTGLPPKDLASIDDCPGVIGVLEPGDTEEGRGRSYKEAVARAKLRIGEAYEEAVDRHRVIHNEAHCGKLLSEHVVSLNTRALLEEEAEYTMNSYISQLSGYVEIGTYALFSIRTRYGRSLLRVDPYTLAIREHIVAPYLGNEPWKSYHVHWRNDKLAKALVNRLFYNRIR